MPVTITYLEMLEPPSGEALPMPEGAALVRADPPSVPFYRFLYDEVGRDWQWVDRKGFSDEDLVAVVQDPRVEVHVVYHRGTPAGYFEIDRREEGQANLAYFGLMPGFLGRGLGRWLLDAAVRTAWRPGPARVHVNTCTLDHPAALPLYLSAGFVACRERTVETPAEARLDDQLAFAREIDRLKGVERRTLVMDGSRNENSAEHSWHLAVLALVLGEHADPPVDLQRVLRMVLLHDLVEIDAGDTYAYDEVGQAGRAEREREAAERIFGLLPADQAARMAREWEEFEAAETPEARFAHALDRTQPLLNNYFTDGALWRRHGIRLDQVLHRMAPVRQVAPALWQRLEPLVLDAARRGWLAPP